MIYKSLGDIAELTAGVITQRVLDNSSAGEIVYVLVPKAIHDGILDEESLATEMLNSELSIKQYGKFLIEDGEIAMKCSSPYDACKVARQDHSKKLLVPSFCCKIKVTDPSIDTDYLVTFLNSSFCRKELESRCHTRTINLTRKSDLEKIKVPILPMEEQKKIAERYINICKLKKVVSSLIELEDERNFVLFNGEQEK